MASFDFLLTFAYQKLLLLLLPPLFQKLLPCNISLLFDELVQAAIHQAHAVREQLLHTDCIYSVIVRVQDLLLGISAGVLQLILVHNHVKVVEFDVLVLSHHALHKIIDDFGFDVAVLVFE